MSAPKSSDKPAKKIENTTERQIKSVSAPIAEPLSKEVLYQKKKVSTSARNSQKGEETEQTVVNVPVLQQHLFGEGRLKREDVVWIIERATELFAREPNVLKIDSPAITVCGDVHGQFYDLVKLFEVGGDPASTTYLFLGDYVDRGSFSIEVVLLLYANKINNPKSFFMIRGNHECRHLTQYFTFREECIHKYDIEIYNLVMDSFDALPLAAIMSKQFLCVHGGISPEIQTIDDIRNIDRFREPPESGPMCDLLWADPMANFNAKSEDTFEYNDVRGCSYMYGYKAVVSFLERNNLLSIIRAHEVQDQGYRMHPKNEATGFPTVITIFSAPNYLDAYNNKGAVLRYEKNVMNIRQFNHSPHPYWLPNFMDVFNWSLPFVAEKVGEILLAVLNLVNDEEDEKEEAKQLESDAEKEKRRQELRAKVKSVSKILRMYSILRQERETLMMIKSFTPENKIPQGLLSGGVTAIRDALGDFEKAKDVDKVNEKRPVVAPNENLPLVPNEKLKTLRDSLKDLPVDDDEEANN